MEHELERIETEMENLRKKNNTLWEQNNALWKHIQKIKQKKIIVVTELKKCNITLKKFKENDKKEAEQFYKILQDYKVVEEEDKNIITELQKIKKDLEIEKTNLNKKCFKKKEKITSLRKDNITLIDNYKLNDNSHKLKFESCKEENKKLKKDLEKFKNDTSNTINDAEKTLEILEKSNKILQQQINKNKNHTQHLKLEIEAAKNSLVLKDTELKACLAENQTITANLDITKKNFEQKNITLYNTLQQTKQTCEESTKNLERDKKALELELEVFRARYNTERVLVRQLPQVNCRKKRA